MTGATQDIPHSAHPPATGKRAPARFVTTRWSMVVQAGRAEADAPNAREALARLCQAYWFPLYAHVRRRGYSAHDAEDLTQGFFARLLARQSIAQADPNRGRFRSFILTALNHYLADEWARDTAAKRGGAHETLSLDLAGAEQRFIAEFDPAAPPDRAFDREWALALLSNVLSQLETEYREAGKADVFLALKPTLTAGGASEAYAALAARIGVTEGAVKVAVHRLRQRYRALLKAEIADTVVSKEEAGDELRFLLAALGP